MITPPSRCRAALRPVGRWSCLRSASHAASTPSEKGVAHSGCEQAHELAARQLLQRSGVVFRKMLTREKLPMTWASLIRIYRRLELRGDVRGGRFVAGFSGEQFALPQAVELLRHLKRQEPRQPISVLSADPLNLQGILTPEERVSPSTKRRVLIGEYAGAVME